jgi:hypothetical protein
MENQSGTVSFNVGGKVYEVSRSLLGSFPRKTLLALKASDVATLNDPVFIDRDGDRFAYCLDYMRDGTVCLPANIPKGSFLQELKHFGFENVQASAIDQADMTAFAGNLMIQYGMYVREEIEDMEREVKNLNLKIRMMKLAQLCFNSRFARGKVIYFRIDTEESKQLWPVETSVLNQYLANYGLCCTNECAKFLYLTLLSKDDEL